MQTSLWLFHTQAREYFCLSDLRLCHPHLWSLPWNTVFFKHLTKLVFECVIHKLKAGSVFLFWNLYLDLINWEMANKEIKKRCNSLTHISSLSLSIYIYIYLSLSIVLYVVVNKKFVRLLNDLKTNPNVYSMFITC